jgi:hypothetical protein
MPMGMPGTTRVTISRAVQNDAYGDPQDINVPPLYTDVPAIIAYDGRVMQDPATGTPRQVTSSSVVFNKGTDVRQDDRLTDQQTGQVYQVTGVTLHPAYGVPGDVWCAVSAVG